MPETGGKAVTEKVKPSEKPVLFGSVCKPKIIGKFHGQQLKLVTFRGPFVS